MQEREGVPSRPSSLPPPPPTPPPPPLESPRGSLPLPPSLPPSLLLLLLLPSQLTGQDKSVSSIDGVVDVEAMVFLMPGRTLTIVLLVSGRTLGTELSMSGRTLTRGGRETCVNVKRC